MARYLVERRFRQGLDLPISDEGVAAVLDIIDRNTELGVTWVHSYVSEDKRTTYCLYEGPNPEAIRRAAARNNLPIERITKVSVLDPYFFR